MPNSKIVSYLPNALSLSRVILFPVFIYLYHNLYFNSALIILIFSMLTDFFDGYFARKFKVTSDTGAILDPIADKAFTCLYYIFLYVYSFIPLWLMAIVFFRNFSQLMSVPILSWWLKRSFKVKPKLLPKYITALTFIYTLVPLIGPLWFLDSALHTFLIILVLMGEIKILADYLPRLIKIAFKKHDTFE